MKYIYTLTPRPQNVCVLANDMAEIVAATGGQAFSNTVTSEKLLDAEEIFNLQRTVEVGAKISVRSIDVGTAEYWALLASEYPAKSFQELKTLGF